MEKIKQVKKEMEEKGVKFDLPWLQLGIKQEGGGVKPTGPHKIKFIKEPKVGKGKDPVTQQERQELHFIVEEGGVEKKWNIPLYMKDGSPHYLLSRLEEVSVGDEVVLEMKNKGIKNYIEVLYENDKEDLDVIQEGEYPEDFSDTEQDEEW